MKRNRSKLGEGSILRVSLEEDTHEVRLTCQGRKVYKLTKRILVHDMLVNDETAGSCDNMAAPGHIHSDRRSLLLLNTLPADVMEGIADHLNPREISQLSSCCKNLRSMLPPLLCIRIIKMQRERYDGANAALDAIPNSTYCLTQRFFVSKAVVPMASTKSCENETERAVIASAETRASYSRNNYRPLHCGQRLEYGKDYWFWSFDYQRNQRVFLGRQVRITDYEESTIITAANNNNNNGTPHIVTKYRYGYHVGLQPEHPNQTWQIHDILALSALSTATPATTTISSETTVTQSTVSSKSKKSLALVPWGANIGLSVGGTHPKLDQPDSMQRRWLSAPPASQARQSHNTDNNDIGSSLKFWHVSREELGDGDECHLQLMPCEDYCNLQQQRRRHLQLEAQQQDALDVTRVTAEESTTSIIPEHATASSMVVYDYPLATYPTPEVCDKGLYVLYSPDQLRFGTIDYPGSHANVPFLFFTWKGMMYVRAHNLKFWLGIPVLLEDANTIVGTLQSSPLLGLFHKRSSRWGCIKYYFATSADVNEGTPLNMPGFLARVTDHDDHTVLQKKFSRRLSSEELPAAKGGEVNSHAAMNIGDGGDAETMNAVVMGDNGGAAQGGNDEGSEMEDLVYIHVKDAVLDMSTPNFPRDDSRVWQFVLC